LYEEHLGEEKVERAYGTPSPRQIPEMLAGITGKKALQ
jgi:hypothetical protein